MKSILQPIKPQYCELIVSGKKTIEVRKTRPKLDVPFKVYIYCTKGENLWKKGNSVFLDRRYNRLLQTFDYMLNGKVIGEYVCDEIEELRYDALEQCYIMRSAYGHNLDEEFKKGTCLTYKEAYEYCKNLKCDSEHTDMFYGWHISNLKIYDKPKELKKFVKYDFALDYEEWEHYAIAGINGKEPDINDYRLTRPFRSWGYIDEIN